MRNLGKEFGSAYSPNPLLKQMVKKGKLGRKSGEGFYNWQKEEK
jgi:3-hydroxybutyryl-CoA dehydrogenase